MDPSDTHAVVIRRLQFLHDAFMEASAGLQAVQFVQVGPLCNHANWIVGHHLWEKDVLLVEWPIGKTFRPREFDALYGFGSKPEAPGAYPDCDALRRHIADAHEAALAGLTADTLTQPPAAAPPVFPTRLDCALHFIHDASYHLGQLNYVRKLVDRSQG